MKILSHLTASFIFILTPQLVSASHSRLGSVHVTVNQRFWDDQRLSHVNGFSEWGAIGIDMQVGVYEFAYRIEPYVGFGFIRDTSNLYLLNEDGSYALDANGKRQDSADNLKYTVLSFSTGLRHKFWEPEFFILIPYVHTGLTYRFGWVEKQTQAVGELTKSKGGDFGMEVGGGIIVSFVGDPSTKSDLNATWDLKDFGMSAQVRYLPGGWGRHGLGLISGTAGWDFGLGLFLDW